MPASNSPTSTAQKDWTWTDTPDPNQDILTIFVETQKIRPPNPVTGDPGNKPTAEIQALGTQPYVAPTTFDEVQSAFALQHLNFLGVGTWQFIGRQNMGEGVTAFHFFPAKTAAEMAIPWESKSIEGAHHWDTVVLDVWTETDYSMPQSASTIDFDSTNTPQQGIITAPTIRIRSVEIPQIEEGSIIVTRKYLSATEPKLQYHRVPQPMNMDVQVNGASRFFERVIHDTIIVEATLSGTRQILSNGESSDVGGVVGSQTFEATNFIERKPYFRLDDWIRNQLGLWERTTEEVIPPKIQPQIVDRS